MQRITYASACVLQALANGSRYGFSIMEATGLPSGTTYQILRRFEREELVRSNWEELEAFEGEGRPRRRYYRITAEGKRALARAHERFARELAALPGPAPS